MFFKNTPAYDNASPYHVWLQKAQPLLSIQTYEILNICYDLNIEPSSLVFPQHPLAYDSLPLN